MAKPTPAFSDLEDLLDLGQPGGIDMRPTLLRVLTDLYLQRPTHSPDDDRYFTELALRLIEATDEAARAAFAARIAPHPFVPRAVVERLASDVPQVAAPILRQSPVLTSADLSAIASAGGTAYAGIIATREIAAAPAEPAVSMVVTAAVENEVAELAELFYAAGAAERRLVLISLDYSTLPAREPLALLQRADIWRLESAALQHNLDAVVREFERTLGLSSQQARRMLGDELGEPIVVAAKAMVLPADVLQRMLLFANPHVGQSVDRVYELSTLYGEITVDAARRLIAILCDADQAEHRSPRHEPVSWRVAAENARRALAEISRRPEAQAPSRARTASER